MAYTEKDPVKQRKWLIKKGWYPTSGWIHKKIVTLWTKNLFNRGGGRRKWIGDQESAIHIQNIIDNKKKVLLKHV